MLKLLLPFAALAGVLLAVSPLAAQNYTMNGNPITDCNGSFFDPGGPTGNYANNQSFNTTICAEANGGTHIRLDFSGIDLAAGDELCFYDGDDNTAPLLSCAADYPPGPIVVQATAANPGGCLTVVFTSDGAGTASGWSAGISCVASCQQVLSELVSTNPIAIPADTGWIDICPGKRVTFVGQGLYPQNNLVYTQSDFTTTFEWSFGDGDIAYGPEVSHVFDEAGGFFVQLFLTDAQGCKSTNLLNQRIRVAPRPAFGIANAIDNTICARDTVQLSAAVGGSASSENLTILPATGSFSIDGSRADSLPLPDGTGIPYSTSLYFTEFSPGQTLTNISDLEGICVDMEHSWARDIEIEITCPNGTTVILHNHPGNVGGQVFLGEPNDNDNLNPIPGLGYDYCWTPTATNPYWIQYFNTVLGGGGTLPPGDYQSFQPLTNLLGCPLNGEWTITSTDLWPIDNGFIFSWGINFNDAIYPNVETFEPGIDSWGWQNNNSIFYASPDSIAAAPINAGTASYVFNVIDGFGCVWDTTLRINVLPFTHPDCFSCQNEYFALRDTAVCAGQPVPLNGSAVAGNTQTVRFEAAPDYRFGAANHPHNNPYSSPIAVSSLGFNLLSNPIQQIKEVCVDIETDFDADLNIYLRSPDNKTLELSTGNGGSGDNYKITCFSPTAVTPIVGQAAPFNGTYQPEGAWSSLNNAQINGDWKLLVSDGFGVNQFGHVRDWQIAFNIPNNINYTWANAAGLSCNNCPTPTATPAASTDYILTATDNFNCVHKDTVTVSVVNFFPAPTGLTVTNMDNGQMTWVWTPVAGVSTYEVNVNGTGWVPVAATTYTVNGLNPGDLVNLQVRAVGGSAACPPAEALANQVFVDCTLVTTLDFTQPCTCPGSSDGAVNVLVSGQQGQTVFYTDFGSNLPYTNGNLTFYPAGTYKVWAVDAAGCRDTVDFLITQPDTFAFNISSTTVLCNGGNTGTATVSATGGTGNLSFVWQRCTGGPFSNGNTAVNLTAGCYRVTVTDQIGCTAAATEQVMENPPFSLVTSQDSVTCHDGQDGTATVVVSGAMPPYTYLWDNGDVTATADQLFAEFHSVTVTDNLNCQAVTSVQVLQPPLLGIDSTVAVNQSCAGVTDGEVAVFARGGVQPYQYAWSGTSQTTSAVSGLPGGTYTVTVTDANGCTTVGQTVVNAPAALALNFSSVQNELCATACDGAATIALSGGTAPYGVTWSTPTVPPNSLTATNLCPGSYQLTVTDAAGCSLTQTFAVAPATALSVQFTSTTPSCVGLTNGSIQAQPAGGTTPYTYAWSNTQTSATAQNLTCGVYTLTLTDAAGCSLTATNNLDCPDALAIDSIVVTPIKCFGQSTGSVRIVATGGTGTYTYLWSDPNQQTGVTAVNLPAGPYTVTVSDASGCSLVVSATVSQSPVLTASLTTTPARCVGESNGTASVFANGGFSPYSYVWSNGVSGTDLKINDLPAGSIGVTVTDANGCTVVPQPATVGEPASVVTIGASQTQTACFGEATGAAQATASGGNGAPYSFGWSNNLTGANMPNLAVGNYTLTVYDALGCTASTSIDIQQFDSITVQTQLVPPTCFGYTDGQAAVALVLGGAGQGQAGNYTFQWGLPGGPTGVYVNTVPGDVNFNLTVTDQQGCDRSFTYRLTQPQEVVPATNVTDVTCFGFADGTAEVVSIQGDFPVATYAWSSSAATAQATDLAAGKYTVTVTDTKGCTGSATVAIAEPAVLVNTLFASKLVCNGDSTATLSTFSAGGTPGYSYTWSTGTQTTASVGGQPAGTYYVTVTDANGCVRTDSVVVDQPNPVSLDIETQDTRCFGERNGRVILTVSGGTGPYRYALGDAPFSGSPTFLGLLAGDYGFSVRDANGCVTRDSFTIGQPLPIEVTATPIDTTIIFGEPLVLEASATNNSGVTTFEWRPALIDSFYCGDAPVCIRISMQPLQSNTFTVVATDSNGCQGQVRVSFVVEKPRGVYVPTGFTPNGDNVNDLLQVFGKGRQVKTIKTFRVYDRWGELVYQDLDFPVNDTNRGWDGTLRGKDCQAGLYVWTAEVEYLDGYLEDLHGEAMLIR